MKNLSGRGFTLIELMVAVAVVAILAAVALPSYTRYVQRARLVEGVASLADMRLKMEQYFQDNRTYVGACAPATVAPLPVPTTFWVFSCPLLTQQRYQVMATGQGTLAGFVYTMDEANTRATPGVPAGWTGSLTCWVLKPDGSC